MSSHPSSSASPAAAANASATPNPDSIQKMNATCPLSASHIPLSSPTDELQIHFLADKLEFIPDVAKALWGEWEYIYTGFYDIHSLPEVEAQLKSEFCNRDSLNTCFVGTINNKFACTGTLASDDTFHTHAYFGTRPWLTCLYVSPEFRGKGIATKIFLRITKRAEEHGFKHVWLFTQQMQASYAKIGNYKIIETLDIYGHPYTVMRCDFLINGKPVPQYTVEDAQKEHAKLHQH